MALGNLPGSRVMSHKNKCKMSRPVSKKLTRSENEFLNSLLIKLAAMPAGEDIAPVLMKQIKGYTNASLAVISKFDPNRRILEAFHVEGNTRLIQSSRKLLGDKIFRTEMVVTDDLYKFLLANYVKRFDELSGITYGATPAILDKAVKSIIGISCFLGISLVFNKKLFGTILLAFRKEEPGFSAPFLESFGHLAAVSLRRNIAEKKLNVLMAENQQVIKQLESLNYWKTEEKEKERVMIVNILREETGQTLSALKMDVGWLLENHDNKIACKEKLKSMDAVISDSINFICKVTSELHPSVLDNMGLQSAVEWLVSEYQKRTGLNIRLLTDIKKGDQQIELACFRIIEEALDNVHRHA